MLYNNNKAITFARSITVRLIMMHSSLFVNLHQNYCLEMDGTTANYSVHMGSYQLTVLGVQLNLVST